MRTPRPHGAGPSARKPPPRSFARSHVRWVGLALAACALLLEGCQSGGGLNPFAKHCNGCGTGGPLSKLGGLFGRNRAAGGLSEPPIYADGIVEEGVAGEIITAPSIPSGGTIIQTPRSSTPSGGALEIDPLPEPSGRLPLDGKQVGQAGSTRPAGYQLTLGDPASRPDREPATPLSVRIADALPRPAEEVSTTSGQAIVTSLPASPVAASEANRESPVPSSNEVPSETPPASMPVEVSTTPAIPVEVPSDAAPGLRSFSPVEPQLAGGSFPASPGFEYLAQKGYRTLLDLRDPTQIRPDDIAQSHHWGLRHVLLPASPDSFDAALVARFEQELAPEARPVYFCDEDGSRSAALWLAHRVQVDKVDLDLARRDALPLGPLGPPLLERVEALVRPAPPEPDAQATPASEPPLTQVPAGSAEPVSAVSTPATADSTAPSTLAAIEPADAAILSDPTGWRPYAAMFLSVLGVPVAYWGCASLSVSRRSGARASLAAPERRIRSIPAESDA